MFVQTSCCQRKSTLKPPTFLACVSKLNRRVPLSIDAYKMSLSQKGFLNIKGQATFRHCAPYMKSRTKANMLFFLFYEKASKSSLCNEDTFLSCYIFFDLYFLASSLSSLSSTMSETNSSLRISKFSVGSFFDK